MALSEGSKVSGFSDWIADLLTGLQSLAPEIIMLIVVILVGVLTEMINNTATSNLIIPIIIDLSVKINLNPLYLVVPATLACSLAFTLPVGTGPNSLAFMYGRITIGDMMKCGITMNLLGFAMIWISSNYYMPIIFDTNNNSPEWVNANFTCSS